MQKLRQQFDYVILSTIVKKSFDNKNFEWQVFVHSFIFVLIVNYLLL